MPWGSIIPRPAGGGQFCGESGGRDYPASHTVSYGQLGLEQLASFQSIYPNEQAPDNGFLRAFLGSYMNLKSNSQHTLPLLGPLGDTSWEVWGLDLRYLAARARRRHAANGPGPAGGVQPPAMCMS